MSACYAATVQQGTIEGENMGNTSKLEPQDPLPGHTVLNAVISANTDLETLDVKLREIRDLSRQMRIKLNTSKLGPQDPLTGHPVLDALASAHNDLETLDAKVQEGQNLSTKMRQKLNSVHKLSKTQIK